MYAEHVPAIANGMRSDLDTFRRGVMFAVLSIRQPVRNVPAMLDDLERSRAASAYLFGWKRASYAYVLEHGEALWRDVCALQDPADAIERLLDVPGLGIVKAGFVAQFLGYDVACLDSRNIEREGRNPRAYKITKRGLSAKALRRHVDRYVADVGGRAAEYWDRWCAYVAPDYAMTAEAVSELHLAILPDDFIPF